MAPLVALTNLSADKMANAAFLPDEAQPEKTFTTDEMYAACNEVLEESERIVADGYEQAYQMLEHIRSQAKLKAPSDLKDVRNTLFIKYIENIANYLSRREYDEYFVEAIERSMLDNSEGFVTVRTIHDVRLAILGGYGLQVFNNFHNEEKNELTWETICPNFKHVDLDEIETKKKKGFKICSRCCFSLNSDDSCPNPDCENGWLS